MSDPQGDAGPTGSASPPAATTAGEAETCPECGARFPCGALAGEDSCWCYAVPNVVPVPADGSARCLCPACLARRVAAG